MKIFKIAKDFYQGLINSLKRFPATVGFSTLTSIIVIIAYHNDSTFDKATMDNFFKTALITALGIPLSLCTYVTLDNYDKYKKTLKARLFSYTLNLVILIFYYFLFLKDLSMVSVTRYLAFSIALYVAFIFIPYIYNKIGIELYFIKLFLRLAVTALYSAILYLGIVVILFTINKLLVVQIPERLYMDIFIFIAGIVSVCFFLAGVPARDQKLDESDFTKLFKVLLLYIIMPLISVYTIILYIYFVKIIITLAWPVQLVMHLVLWYSFLSSIVIFMISAINNENQWVKTFTFWLPKLILPLLLMMFISVAKRVNQYGITENRYFVIALGFWVLGIMLYLNISKKKRNIILLISFCMIAFLSVFGPWSSYSISKYSQNHRLKKILSKYSMIRDNKIVKPGKEISEYDKVQISQILYYFSNSHKLSDANFIPKDFKLSNIEEVFGFALPSAFSSKASKYIYYNANAAQPLVNLSGYNYLFDMRNNYSDVKKSSDKVNVSYDTKSTIIKIFYEGKEIYMRNLSDYGNQLYKKFGLENNHALDLKDMTFFDENPHVKIKLIFFSINGFNDDSSGEMKTDYLSFYLLLEVK